MRQLQLVAKKNSADVTKVWLEKQDVYRFHRPVRKRFARNPSKVSNVMDVWKCDLINVEAYDEYNDNYRYILTVIDVFSKYLHLIPIRTKRGLLLPRRFGPYSMNVGAAAQYECAVIRARNF